MMGQKQLWNQVITSGSHRNHKFLILFTAMSHTTRLRINRGLILLGVVCGVLLSAAAQKITNSQVIRDCKLDKYALIWESSPVGDRIICVRKLQIPNVKLSTSFKD